MRTRILRNRKSVTKPSAQKSTRGNFSLKKKIACYTTVILITLGCAFGLFAILDRDSLLNEEYDPTSSYHSDGALTIGATFACPYKTYSYVSVSLHNDDSIIVDLSPMLKGTARLLDVSPFWARSSSCEYISITILGRKGIESGIFDIVTATVSGTKPETPPWANLVKHKIREKSHEFLLDKAALSALQGKAIPLMIRVENINMSQSYSNNVLYLRSGAINPIIPGLVDSTTYIQARRHHNISSIIPEPAEKYTWGRMDEYKLSQTPDWIDDGSTTSAKITYQDTIRARSEAILTIVLSALFGVGIGVLLEILRIQLTRVDA